MLRQYEFEQLNKDKGFHWFDKETLHFFRSRISNWDPISGLFITSESGPFGQGPRAYTVRLADFTTGQVHTIGEFQAYSSIKRAKTALSKARKEGSEALLKEVKPCE
jgi:hypothetical protein